LCFVALANSLESRALTGLWQRLMLISLFLWCAVIGLEAYRGPASPRAPSNGGMRPTREKARAANPERDGVAPR
jgi:hypothetical protein